MNLQNATNKISDEHIVVDSVAEPIHTEPVVDKSFNTIGSRADVSHTKRNILIAIGFFIAFWYLNYFNIVAGTVSCGHLPLFGNTFAASYTLEEPGQIGYWTPHLFGPEEYFCTIADAKGFHRRPTPESNRQSFGVVAPKPTFDFSVYDFPQIPNLIEVHAVSKSTQGDLVEASADTVVYTPKGVLKNGSMVQGKIGGQYPKGLWVCLGHENLCKQVGTTTQGWVVYRSDQFIDNPEWGVLTDTTYINFSPGYLKGGYSLPDDKVMTLFSSATPYKSED